MFDKSYTEDQLTAAVLLVLEGGLNPTQAAKQTGISKRTIQRAKSKMLGVSTPKWKTEEDEAEEVLEKELATRHDIPMLSPESQERVDNTLIARAQFLDEVFETKKVLLKQLRKMGARSQNIDALQKSLKTLTEIEGAVKPSDDTPAAHAKTVNMFQFFNQQLINEGYEGPKLTDADIVKGD